MKELRSAVTGGGGGGGLASVWLWKQLGNNITNAMYPTGLPDLSISGTVPAGWGSSMLFLWYSIVWSIEPASSPPAQLVFNLQINGSGRTTILHDVVENPAGFPISAHAQYAFSAGAAGTAYSVTHEFGMPSGTAGIWGWHDLDDLSGDYGGTAVMGVLVQLS